MFRVCNICRRTGRLFVPMAHIKRIPKISFSMKKLHIQSQSQAEWNETYSKKLTEFCSPQITISTTESNASATRDSLRLSGSKPREMRSCSLLLELPSDAERTIPQIQHRIFRHRLEEVFDHFFQRARHIYPDAATHDDSRSRNRDCKM